MKTVEDISINDLKAGKPKVQRLLYEKCKGKMFALCTRYSNSVADAEDILIQGFTRIFNKINEFDGRNFEGWMKRIFVNEAINHFHQNKNQTWYNSIETDENLVADHSDIYASFSLEDLNRLIAGLPDGCRVIFNLYAIEGYPHKEIAQLLNVSESTSKSQYIRAKQLLQTKIKSSEAWKKEAI